MEERNDLEIKAYLMQSKDALETTKLLLDHQRFREAISRAYYSMFYAASALLCSEGKTTSKHSILISLFHQYFIKTKKFNDYYYKRFVKAFEDRLSADYKVLTPIVDEVAYKKYDDAQKFYQAAEEYLKKEKLI
jgi:uncharacterized protein (UPF0332 family)